MFVHVSVPHWLAHSPVPPQGNIDISVSTVVFVFLVSAVSTVSHWPLSRCRHVESRAESIEMLPTSHLAPLNKDIICVIRKSQLIEKRKQILILDGVNFVNEN